MTTIIEQMAKAYWMASEFAIWEDMHPIGRERAVDAMHAALAVLAECELPDAAVIAGGKAADNATEYDAPKFLEIVFKATVRAIIEEQSS